MLTHISHHSLTHTHSHLLTCSPVHTTHTHTSHYVSHTHMLTHSCSQTCSHLIHAHTSHTPTHAYTSHIHTHSHAHTSHITTPHTHGHISQSHPLTHQPTHTHTHMLTPYMPTPHIFLLTGLLTPHSCSHMHSQCSHQLIHTSLTPAHSYFTPLTCTSLTPAHACTHILLIPTCMLTHLFTHNQTPTCTLMLTHILLSHPLSSSHTCSQAHMSHLLTPILLFLRLSFALIA